MTTELAEVTDFHFNIEWRTPNTAIQCSVIHDNIDIVLFFS